MSLSTCHTSFLFHPNFPLCPAVHVSLGTLSFAWYRGTFNFSLQHPLECCLPYLLATLQSSSSQLPFCSTLLLLLTPGITVLITNEVSWTVKQHSASGIKEVKAWKVFSKWKLFLLLLTTAKEKQHKINLYFFLQTHKVKIWDFQNTLMPCSYYH